MKKVRGEQRMNVVFHTSVGIDCGRRVRDDRMWENEGHDALYASFRYVPSPLPCRADAAVASVAVYVLRLKSGSKVRRPIVSTSSVPISVAK